MPQLLVAFGRSSHQRHIALLRQHYQVPAGEEQLPIPVAPAFPFQFASPGIDARQNGFVKAVKCNPGKAPTS